MESCGRTSQGAASSGSSGWGRVQGKVSLTESLGNTDKNSSSVDSNLLLLCWFLLLC